MRRQLSFLSVAAIGLLSVATGATAREKSADKDPNRMICEKQEVLGSRLASKRICKTAAEWQAQRREDRNAIDRAQTVRTVAQ